MSATYKKIRRTYYNMRSRCYNKKTINYDYYGGRGVSVCPSWMGANGLDEFYRHVITLEGFGIDKSLDRIDNDGDYEPGNVRWATQRQQLINKRPKNGNNTGYAGIYKPKDRNTYRVTINIEGQCIHVGRFKELDDAMSARLGAEASCQY